MHHLPDSLPPEIQAPRTYYDDLGMLYTLHRSILSENYHLESKSIDTNRYNQPVNCAKRRVYATKFGQDISGGTP
jgi:hypothetical protein